MHSPKFRNFRIGERVLFRTKNHLRGVKQQNFSVMLVGAANKLVLDDLYNMGQAAMPPGSFTVKTSV